MKNIADIRTDYTKFSIDELGLKANALDQFRAWFTHAVNTNVSEVNAMVLSTVSKHGVPSARVLLLKGVENGGFTFFTNYNSSKGSDLAINPNACLTFFWRELEQQIRVTGIVEKIDENLSEAYFHSRPRGSQISALASNQSSIVNRREELTNEVERLEKLYENKEIPKPENWGGYVLKASSVEFWQGRSSRLHDRFLYSEVNGVWQIERLAP
jgi:pyridoxamine 5'-phosphate oxidase